MISDQPGAETMLSPAQLTYAAQYITRWRYGPDSDDVLRGVENEVRVALRTSELVRGIVGALLRERAPIKGSTATGCGRCGKVWRTPQDAWVCYSSGCRPINEVR